MLFKSKILEGIQEGKVELAFRRWVRPSVKQGTQLRTAIGIVGIDAVQPVKEEDITERDARLSGFESRAAPLVTLRGEGVLYCVTLHHEGADPREALRARAPESQAELDALLRRIADMDRRARGGPGAQRILSLMPGPESPVQQSAQHRQGPTPHERLLTLDAPRSTAHAHAHGRSADSSGFQHEKLEAYQVALVMAASVREWTPRCSRAWPLE